MSTDLSPDSLPPKVAARVEAELQPGEKLVWLGQPSPWRGFGASHLSVQTSGLPTAAAQLDRLREVRETLDL